MEKEVSSLELRYLEKEFQKLKGARVDKIYSRNKKDIFIQFYKAELKKPLLRLFAPNVSYITSYKPKFGHPDSFTTALRKRLTNAILKDISQIGHERILKITFEKKDGSIFKEIPLYVEFFLKGNIIFIMYFRPIFC